MRLSQVAEGRDNNFNLIRICAALTVLFSHSFNLATGFPDAEPLVKRLGMSPASIAVDAFFVTSGFLVTSSLLSRKSLLEFLIARALRIVPALTVMVILTVFGLGLLFTRLHWALYLQDPLVWKYLIKNVSLMTGVAFGLPGVFESNPFRSVVNGSLWTLTAEVHMYALLAILWGSVSLIPRWGRTAFTPAIALVAFGAAYAHIGGHYYSSAAVSSFGFLFMFFAGSAYYLLRAHVILSRPLFWVSIILLVVSTIDREAFFLVYSLTIGYILLFLAYVPAAGIRQYNLLGDYSYGVYIYAFPVQQTIVALIPGISIFSLAIISTAVVLTFASLSWHLLEEPALGFKDACIGHIKHAFGIRRPAMPGRTRR